MAKPVPGEGFRIAALISKYLQRKLTEAEEQALEAWLGSNERRHKLFRELTSANSLEQQLRDFERADGEAGWKRLQQKMTARAIVPVEHSRKLWASVAAAAVIVLVFSWQLLFRVQEAAPPLTSRYGGDVLPGMPKAELVLSNGSTIILGGNRDTAFAESGSAVQRTASGMIRYSKMEPGSKTAWNTIRVPNGGEFRMALEDGTQIWLNAATVLRYPVQFTGAERKVELLEGEAYFEIAKNKEKPFIVVANRMEVQAIGTAFDVNTYANVDSIVSTTLTEGRVKVAAGKDTRLLLPGEQIQTDGATVQVTKADVEAATAWKNGLFIFNGAPLAEVMEQVARWYNVRIEYDRSFREQKFFTGEIKRNVPVSKLLEIMELTGIARFSIANDIITVQPYRF